MVTPRTKTRTGSLHTTIQPRRTIIRRDETTTGPKKNTNAEVGFHLAETKHLNRFMTEYTDEPLVSRDVSMRRAEQEKQKLQQKKDMENRLVTAPQSAWNQSVAASTDTKMRDLLSQVRQSDVGLPDALTRLHGTWIHNQK